MKNLFPFIAFIAFSSYSISFSQNNCTFLKNVSVQADVMFEGAHGIKIYYQMDFDSLKKTLKSDSVLRNSDFDIDISFATSSGKIKPAKGYSILKNNTNELVYKYHLFSSRDLFQKQSKYCFIPYAAFDLLEGEHSINIEIALKGKDGNHKHYQQKADQQNILIHKKPQHTITFNIDYIEVNKLNAKGNVWDFSPFGYNSDPDVGVAFMIGGLSIWKNNVENNTIFAMGPKSKNIAFMISDGDEASINVVDVDLMFDDPIGEYKIKPTAIDTGKLHTIDKPNGSIVSCNMNWKVE